MSVFTIDDLATLPRPEIIETLDFEALLSTRKTVFVQRSVVHDFDYTVVDLETDPAVIQLEESAYREMVLRARGNDIARAAYLYYAKGSEVDHLGAFYDVIRLPGESDDRLKGRIILAVQGRSTGGTEPRYRFVAVSASLRVADAVVYTVGTSPVIHIAVFATDNNGVADAELLALVTAAVTDPEVRMVNDTIVVESAVVVVQPVVANITLLPSTPETLLATLAAALPGQWIAESGLGRDLTHDWLKSKLMVAGAVYSVTIVTPASAVIVPPYQATRIGTVTLNLIGRAY